MKWDRQPEAMQLWGGVECTVNRVGDTYMDQLELAGHDSRADDISLFQSLGITALRYPVLWERVAPDHPAEQDWRWSDARLGRIRAAGIRPIVGLIHHGSGPRYTNLLDDGFAPALGRYAADVAARYPWVEDWTPINEPLTTARFSALYGHWYPHHRDEASFWRALLNQADGTRAAMAAVRRVNPAARLIQTDDLGRTYATARLADQAAFDNVRRWAGWDLLFGRITADHPLWPRLDRLGFGDRLRRIADDPCPPAIVGINHYLTSDRFLDHRLRRYPVGLRGGNEQMAYADVEAIRVLDPPPAGLQGVLTEAWERYGVPIALTEVHNGCTREEQLRWVAQAWDVAATLRADGVDVRAVTAWALLGSHNWDTLLTRPGRYETGVFDVKGGTLQPTALAALWRGLPLGGRRHPVSMAAGWWQRGDRLLYEPQRHPAALTRPPAEPCSSPVLIVGGAEPDCPVVRACRGRGLRHVVVEGDVSNIDDIRAALERERPWSVVHVVGDESVARRLADECRRRRIACLCFTSALTASVGDAPGQDPVDTCVALTVALPDGDGHDAIQRGLDRLVDSASMSPTPFL